MKEEGNENNQISGKAQLSSSMISPAHYDELASHEDVRFRPQVVLREKVVIVGDEAVGKTSLVQMFTSDGSEYPKNYVMTTDVDFSMKSVIVPDTNVEVDLFLYDMAGQSIFHQRELSSKNWENCNYVVYVFDVSSRKSLQSCTNWIKSVRKSNNEGGRPIKGLLVANKIDLREMGIDSRSELDTEEGVDFARQHNLEYFECSASMGLDVEPIFNYIVSQSWQKYDANRESQHERRL